jgi:hypothetical protein
LIFIGAEYIQYVYQIILIIFLCLDSTFVIMMAPYIVVRGADAYWMGFGRDLGGRESAVTKPTYSNKGNI